MEAKQLREWAEREAEGLVDRWAPEGWVPQEEKVDHPAHYQGKGIEVIDILEGFGLGFHLGNAVKYILRAGKKGDEVEDLKKAIWYIERYINGRE